MQLHLHVAYKYISFCGHMIYLSRCAILWLSNASTGEGEGLISGLQFYGKRMKFLWHSLLGFLDSGLLVAI